jgi:acetyltransferase-like isoleucine patch superfamily enzyme
MSALRLLFRNPLTLYLRFVLEAARNVRRYRDFGQGYMSRVVNCEIEPHVRIFPAANVMNCRIGSFSYVAEETKIGHTNIGRFCSIGPNCRIGLEKHPTRGFVSTSPVFFSTVGQSGSTFVKNDLFEESSPIHIGNDVWIGANVSVVDGIRIGDGAIVGAGAVVVSDIPDYAVFGGVPARLIRLRFNELAIAFLTQFKWWDKDLEWIQQNHEIFQNIEQFMAKFGFQAGAFQGPEQTPVEEPISKNELSPQSTR